MPAVEKMVEEGVVKAVEDGTLVVLVERPDACASCAARGACTTLGPRRREVRVAREGGGREARPGDRVTLEIRSVTFLRASLLGYLVPTMAFFAGVAGVLLLLDPGAAPLGLGRDLVAFLAGLACVLLTFVGLWVVGSRPEARRRYAPRIIAVHPADS